MIRKKLYEMQYEMNCQTVLIKFETKRFWLLPLLEFHYKCNKNNCFYKLFDCLSPKEGLCFNAVNWQKHRSNLHKTQSTK